MSVEGSVIISGVPESVEEGLVAGLPPEEVHVRALEARRILGRAQRALGFWLMEVERRQIYRHFGCSSVFHYAELHLELAPHTIAEYLRTGKELDKLPKFAQAVSRGEVAPTKVREISRVATSETEDYWMQVATSSTCRQVEKLVALTPKGGLPPIAGQSVAVNVTGSASPEITLSTDGASERGDCVVNQEPAVTGIPEESASLRGAAPVGPSRYRTKLVLELENDEMAIIEKALEKARAQTGSRERSELMIHVARSFLEAGGAEGASSPPYRITLHSVPEMNIAWVEGATGPQFVPESTVEEAMCNAEILDLREEPSECGKVPAPCGEKCCAEEEQMPNVISITEATSHDTGRPTGDGNRGPRVRRTLSSTLRRKVIERDGGRCTVPGCTNRCCLDAHHIKSLRHGGRNTAANMTTACRRHHRMVHKGFLSVEGCAPNALIWRDAKGKRLRVSR